LKNQKGNKMDRELISNQDLIVSNMLFIEAIIAVLEKKGIAKREEFIYKILLHQNHLYRFNKIFWL